MKVNISGTGVALVTPFKQDLSIDFDALKQLLDTIYTSNVKYLVVNGSTGESATISWKEKLAILEYVLKNNTKGLPIIFGHGGNDTRFLIDKIGELNDYPISAILSVSPYYNRPSQEGIRLHFESLADHSPFPIIIYNVPSRTASNISPATTRLLSHHENILGIKEANTNPEQWTELQKINNANFYILSGDDITAPMYLQSAAKGVISVAANIIPQLYSQLVEAILNNNISEGMTIYRDIYPLLKHLTAKGNPVSVKSALYVKGIGQASVRLPLVSADSDFLNESKTILKTLSTKKGTF